MEVQVLLDSGQHFTRQRPLAHDVQRQCIKQGLVLTAVHRGRGNQISFKWHLAHSRNLITINLIDNFLCTK